MTTARRTATVPEERGRLAAWTGHFPQGGQPSGDAPILLPPDAGHGISDGSNPQSPYGRMTLSVMGHQVEAGRIDNSCVPRPAQSALDARVRTDDRWALGEVMAFLFGMTSPCGRAPSNAIDRAR